MDVVFTEYVNDAVRLLVLLYATREYKSIKMTDNKIKLYDYYLKFPCTMLSEEVQGLREQWNFDEYYAFFHWQPDLIKYRQSINYLIAKGFIKAEQESNLRFYKITETGCQVLDKINSPYKRKLIDLTNIFIPTVARLSDSKIEQLIRRKSDIYLRMGGVRNEN